LLYSHKFNYIFIYINVKKIKFIKMINNYVNDKKFSIIYKNNNLNIINYSEITGFTDTEISIRYNDELYYIEGNELVISKMIDNEILITGNISSVFFK